jgi:hypothetical protein
MPQTTAEYMIINFEETFDEVLKLYKKFADD